MVMAAMRMTSLGEVPVVSLKPKSCGLLKNDCSHLPLTLGYDAKTTTLYLKNHSA